MSFLSCISVQEVEACVALLDKECVALSPQVGSLRIFPLHAGLGTLNQRLYESKPDPLRPGERSSTEEEESAEAPQGSATRLSRIRKKKKRRRVVVTDALAEASFSMPGIRYVVDTGLQLRTVSLRSNVSHHECSLFEQMGRPKISQHQEISHLQKQLTTNFQTC